MINPIEEIKPVSQNTSICEDTGDWRPANFLDFLEELKHLMEKSNEALLFRGHRQSDWLLDSTFSRSMKKQLGLPLTLRYPIEFLEDVSFQHALARKWLQKVDSVQIHPQLLAFEQQEIDTYYEYHRHLQQNSKNPTINDIEPLGTNLIDFTQDWKVGLFFANLNRLENTEGALYIVRQAAIGDKTFINTAFNKVVLDMRKWLHERPSEAYRDLPYLLYPQKQLNNSLDPKPERQKAIYFAQTDFRFDLGLSWYLLSNRTKKQVYFKIILPSGTTEEVQKFLASEKITNEYIFPSTCFDPKPL